MKRLFAATFSAGLLVSLSALAASCGGPAEPVNVPPAPSGTAAAVATLAATAAASAAPTEEPIDLRNPKEISISSWTDDDAIRALAQDCHWDPGGCLKTIAAAAMQSVDSVSFLPEGQELPAGDTRILPAEACQNVYALACARVPAQSCAPDECSQTDYDCVPGCDKACGSCADKCVAGCESCKSGCRDDACRLACAEKCGECRQACVQELDQCASAHCSEVSETCFKERDDEWNKSVCPKVCDKVAACVEKCPELEDDWTGRRYRTECADKCMSKHGKGCPQRFDQICKGDPNASVNFFAYHSSRQSGN